MNSNRVVFRKLCSSDAKMMAASLNDKTISASMGTPYPYTLQDALCYIDDANRNGKPKYAILLKRNNDFMGVAALHIHNNKVSASIWLSRNYQGQGYGKEVLSFLATQCFDSLGFSEMHNSFFENNIASQKIQESLGATVLPGEEHIIVNGKEYVKKVAILQKDKFNSRYVNY